MARLVSAIERLQDLLGGTEESFVPTSWYSEIKSGTRGVHVIALAQRFSEEPPLTWRELKRFVSLGFDIGADPHSQAREAEDLRPNDGETLDSYCTRWITAVTFTSGNLAAESRSLAKVLISKVASYFGLNRTAEVLLADDQSILGSTNPLTVFSKLQKKLGELVHSKTYLVPSRRAPSAVVPIHRASLGIKEACRRFKRGICRYAADQCDYLHISAEAAPAPSSRPRDKVCYAYQRDRCTYGSACRFAHLPSANQQTLGTRRAGDPQDQESAAKRPRVDVQPLN